MELDSVGDSTNSVQDFTLPCCKCQACYNLNRDLSSAGEDEFNFFAPNFFFLGCQTKQRVKHMSAKCLLKLISLQRVPLDLENLHFLGVTAVSLRCCLRQVCGPSDDIIQQMVNTRTKSDRGAAGGRLNFQSLPNGSSIKKISEK